MPRLAMPCHSTRRRAMPSRICQAMPCCTCLGTCQKLHGTCRMPRATCHAKPLVRTPALAVTRNKTSVTPSPPLSHAATSNAACNERVGVHCKSLRLRRNSAQNLQRAESRSNLLTICKCVDRPTAVLHQNAQPVQIAKEIVDPPGKASQAGDGIVRGEP